MPVSLYYDLRSSAKSNLRSSAIVHEDLAGLVTSSWRRCRCSSSRRRSTRQVEDFYKCVQMSLVCHLSDAPSSGYPSIDVGNLSFPPGMSTKCRLVVWLFARKKTFHGVSLEQLRKWKGERTPLQRGQIEKGQ